LNRVPPAKRQDWRELAKALVQLKVLTAFQATTLAQGKSRSLILGNYVVLDKLGQGGMGIVLKAQHRRMKRIVALKVLSPNLGTRPRAGQRFQREVEAAGRLNHPNIVAAFDADEADGALFMVMEYIEGIDLSRLVKQQGPLPIDKAVNYVTQAARGLD